MKLKKVLAVILCFAFLLSTTVVVYAEDMRPSVVEVQTYDFPAEEGHCCKIIAKIYSNGDIEYIEIYDNVQTASAYVDKSADKVYSYKGDIQRTISANKTVAETSINPLPLKVSPNSFSSVGSIVYEYYNQGYPSRRSLTLSLEKGVAEKMSVGDLQGTYMSTAEFIGAATQIVKAIMLVSVSAGFATVATVAVVTKALQVLGYAAVGGAIVVPIYIVSGERYRATWRSVSGNTSGTFTGYKFVFQHRFGNTSHTEYDRYYTEDSFGREDTMLAYYAYMSVPVYWGSDGIVNAVDWR